jgi:hypothetical protein
MMKTITLSLDHQTYMKTIALALLVLATALVQAEEKLYDEALAKRAEVVLRVELHHARHALPPDKYPYIKYTVLGRRVFKNESYTKDLDLTGHFDVLGFDNKPGVPAGESTIYIQRYDVAKRQFGGKEGTVWMLVDGGGTNSVSHIGSKTNSQ